MAAAILVDIFISTYDPNPNDCNHQGRTLSSLEQLIKRQPPNFEVGSRGRSPIHLKTKRLNSLLVSGSKLQNPGSIQSDIRSLNSDKEAPWPLQRGVTS